MVFSMDGITIGQIIPELEAGGAERTTIEVAAAVLDAGGQAIVASQGGPMVAELEALGAHHVTMPLASKNPNVMLANRRRLKALIAEKNITLLHARSRAPAWSALWAARAAGIPFVTTYHGVYGGRSKLKKLYNSVMARGDRVIANSHFTADAVRAHFKSWGFFDEARMITIPRGADLSRFDPALITDQRRQDVLAAFGGEDAFRILLPGRLTSWKGQSDLIQAVGMLRQERPTLAVRLVMVGSAQGRDEYVATLASLLVQEGLDSMAHIHGHWDDMAAAYDWADVTVSSSSRPEAFGRVSIEAQAMACPIIGTAHGGSLETIENDVTGLLVAPSDPAAMAAALGRCVDIGPAKREEWGQAGRRRAMSHFSTEAMTAVTLCVYKDVTAAAGQTMTPHQMGLGL